MIRKSRRKMEAAPRATFRLACLMLLPLVAACASTNAPLVSQIYPPETHAWATFDKTKLMASDTNGLADREQSRPMTISDPVRIASISKLVVAMGVMRLVEQGQLDLDNDVSEALGWSLRNPAFPDTPITLRMLLSHQSGLKDDGESYIIPADRTLEQAAANIAIFDNENQPGTYFQYSNLNYVVIGTVLESATDERFDLLMQRLVLEPLGLKACFGWTSCSERQIEQGVTLYAENGTVRKDDAASRRDECPIKNMKDQCALGGYDPGSNGALFSPQGGLRISIPDLAKIGQLFLNDGQHDGVTFLSGRSIKQLIGPQWEYDGSNGATSGGFFCSFGLGVQNLTPKNAICGDTLFADSQAAVGHAGEAYGLLSGLWVDMERGIGIAYFSANYYGQSNESTSLFRPIERELANKISR